jgi:mRNA interferase MazF
VVAPAAGTVVLVPFPFSDLSRAKLRPAVVLAEAGRGDWILSQITSKSYADAAAVSLRAADFAKGSLQLDSYVRPGKLFTAHQSLLAAEAGRLKAEACEKVISAVVRLLRAGTAHQ